MNTTKNTVLLAGATGLVGGHCLTALLEQPSIQNVIPVVRRPFAANDPRVTPLVAEFADLDNRPPSPAEVALCAVGTTIKQAGSKQAFRAVDYEAVLAFARFAGRSGVKTFGLVSSIGASTTSRNFYLRVKGEAEEALGALGFRSFVALRPSLLLGRRTQSRPGESVSQAIFPFLTPLMRGSARRLRAIPSEVVARALTGLAIGTPPVGQHVWLYDEIVAATLVNDK